MLDRRATLQAMLDTADDMDRNGRDGSGMRETAREYAKEFDLELTRDGQQTPLHRG